MMLTSSYNYDILQVVDADVRAKTEHRCRGRFRCRCSVRCRRRKRDQSERRDFSMVERRRPGFGCGKSWSRPTNKLWISFIENYSLLLPDSCCCWFSWRQRDAGSSSAAGALGVAVLQFSVTVLDCYCVVQCCCLVKCCCVVL